MERNSEESQGKEAHANNVTDPSPVEAKAYTESRDRLLLTVALVTSNALAAEAIAQMLDESGLFRLVYVSSAVPGEHEVARAVRATDPEILLLDLGDWTPVAGIVGHLNPYDLRVLPIGFREDWTTGQQATFKQAGIHDLLREPFSPQDLEETVYAAIHRARPITNKNILTFLPAKAGGGCSTVAVHTAAALANEFHRKVVFLEGDRRSGVMSILLNLRSQRGMGGALQDANGLTELAWRNYYETAHGVDFLLADPARRGPLPSWAQYYQLLRFLEGRYEFMVADLPEVVNAATAELVRDSRGVMIVCTPELPSIKMAAYRCAELAECDVPEERVHVLLNRAERSSLSVDDVQKVLKRPVLATLPNDYARIRDAVLGSRLVPPESPFGKGCRVLAEKLGGLPEGVPKPPRFSLFEKLGRMME